MYYEIQIPKNTCSCEIILNDEITLFLTASEIPLWLIIDNR